MNKKNELDMIIPVSIEDKDTTKEAVVSEIIEQYEKYGFTRFVLTAPGKGCRSTGYPNREYFKEKAKLFFDIKSALLPYGIECGWWIMTTLKSGASGEFDRMVRMDGTKTPFSSCPEDPAFRRRFASDVAEFAKIAKPAFMITEDDYSIHASAFEYGCFCEHHLKAFSERCGKYYTKDELLSLFRSKTEEGFALLREWRSLMRDSLVKLAKEIRAAVDEESPEIPIGFMQPEYVDLDGDGTQEIAQALAGKKHTPFSRIYGTFYDGGSMDEIPAKLFHTLYSRQHIKGDFRFYHETDSYPHISFFSSASLMKMIMSTAYSFGFEGSVFIYSQQEIDFPCEDTAYAKMFLSEKKRFNALYNAVKECKIQGVEICFDPFWNTADRDHPIPVPLWAKPTALMGIPYTSESSSVAFWDKVQAKYYDDETIRRYLSKGLFLDGEAAKYLCERGYGEYIGVEIGEDVASGTYGYDLNAREIICEKFAQSGKGRSMPSAHAFACGKNGKLLKITPINPECEVVSEEYDCCGQLVSPAMTRFENKLGGRVIVMGMTLDGNNSQMLYNYRRQRLLQSLIAWCSDEYVFSKENAKVSVIVNKAADSKKSGFIGILSLHNLCGDDVEKIPLHLPPMWSKAKEFLVLDEDGKWQKVNYTSSDDGIVIEQKLCKLSAMYIMCR